MAIRFPSLAIGRRTTLRRDLSWRSTPMSRRRTSRPFSPATTSANCLSYKGIAEGVENSNFLVHTSRGYFILTLYERRVAAKDLPFFLGLMEHLHARGITCPQPVKNQRRRGAGQGRRPAGRDHHLPRRHVDQAAVAGALRGARRGAGEAASRRARFPGASAPTRSRSTAGGRSMSIAARARTRCSATCKRLLDEELAHLERDVAARTCRRASSTPICFPTTCSFSATSCRA